MLQKTEEGGPSMGKNPKGLSVHVEFSKLKARISVKQVYVYLFMQSFENPVKNRNHLLPSFHLLQLDLITDLLGTPSLEAMRTACEGAKAHILRGPHKQVCAGKWEGISYEFGNRLDCVSTVPVQSFSYHGWGLVG